MNTFSFKNALPFFIIALGVVFGAGIAAHAQTAPLTFPIPELGNCKDQADCKVYCADSAHIAACTDFGEAHNLISKEEATRARKFADVLRGAGPGGCKDEASCRAYCADVTHLDACIAFAESHGIVSDADLSEMRRVNAALKAGATMPGGCKTKDQCEAYCSGGGHADECLAFAERAGTLSPEELARARQMTAFVQSGETPGRCTSKDSCEAYCASPDHFDECIAFAEKAKLISPEDLAIAKKTGGRGPGGCSSKEACDAYCNASEHADECLAFAEEHGILSQDKVQEIKDGMGRLRVGVAQAPEEVKACLRASLGEDIIGKIQSGTLTPAERVGEAVQSCFESQMAKVKDKLEQGLKMAPPAVMDCIEKNVGTIDLQKIRAGDAPSPEKGDALRACFESMAREGERVQGVTQERMQQMPRAMQACVKEKLGDLSSVQEPPANLQEVIQGCAQEFGPRIPGSAAQGGPTAGTGTPGLPGGIPVPAIPMMPRAAPMPQLPSQAEGCLKTAYGEDFFDRMKSGEVTPPADFQDRVRQCMMQQFAPAVPGGAPGATMPGTGGGFAPAAPLPTPPTF